MNVTLEDGARVGRYLILHDVDGRVIAIVPSAIAAACEVDDGTLLMLPGGRLAVVPQPFARVLIWLSWSRAELP